MSQIIRSLQSKFQQLANADWATLMLAYMKMMFHYSGIAAPIRRAFQQGVFEAHDK
jgi:hypothetical protein